MGRSYLFECPKCGYKATVSGKADNGVHFCVQTILCRDCKTLHDAVVRVKMSSAFAANALAHRPGKFRRDDVPPTVESVLNRLTIGDEVRGRWITFKLLCPKSSAHKVQPWKNPGKCPKCGAYLERSGLPFRIWD